MAERRKLSPEEEAKVHPPSPDRPRPGRELPMSGAVPTKPGDQTVLEWLMQQLGINGIAPPGYESQMPGQNPAQGVVDTIGKNVMQPARRAIDWLGNLGK